MNDFFHWIGNLFVDWEFDFLVNWVRFFNWDFHFIGHGFLDGIWDFLLDTEVKDKIKIIYRLSRKVRRKVSKLTCKVLVLEPSHELNDGNEEKEN